MPPKQTRIEDASQGAEGGDGAAAIPALDTGVFEIADENRDEFASRFPLTAAAISKWRPSEGRANPHLRVTARRHGFRRGGVTHSAEPTEHLLLKLNAPQVEAILAEPDLVAEIV